MDGLYDTHGYAYIPFTHTTQFYVFVTLVFLLFISCAVYCFYRYMKRKRSTSSPTPQEYVLRSIKELKKQRYVTKEEYKKAYFSLSTTLKEYFFLRYQLPVHDKTDEELIPFFKTHNVDERVILLCKEFFENARACKFANEDSLQEQFEQDCERVEKSILILGDSESLDTSR